MTRAVPSVRIDFLQPAAPRDRVGTALAVIAVVVAMGVLIAWRVESAALEAAVAASAAADPDATRAAPVAVSPSEAKRVAGEVSQARAIASRLAIPWDRLFATLEAAAGPDATLTALRPEDDGRRLRLAGEARDLAGVLAYTARLQRSTTLANVLIASHETSASGDAVRFSLVADWGGR